MTTNFELSNFKKSLLKYILLGTILIIGFWMVDSLIDYFIFSYDTVFSQLSAFEVYFRMTVIFFIIVFLVFSFIISRMDVKQHKELEKIDKLKSEFLRRISHELRTPLISIKGFTNLMKELHHEKLDVDMTSILEEINKGCFRLETLIKNIIVASKLKAIQAELKTSNENLSFLIKFCLNELQFFAETRKQLIILDIHDGLYVNIEKEEIYAVLTNLIINAIKYTPPMGKIKIKTELKEDYVVVSVKDTGIGFNNEQKKKIFQPFGKIERYGQGVDLGIDGTGLGLYISKRIVESHGGKIWMESDGSSKGSTFYFTLPTINN